MTGKVHCAHTLTLIVSRAFFKRTSSNYSHSLPISLHHRTALLSCTSFWTKPNAYCRQFCRQCGCQHLLSLWIRLKLFLRKRPQNHLVQSSGAQCQLFHGEVPSCHAVIVVNVHLAVILVSISKTAKPE